MKLLLLSATPMYNSYKEIMTFDTVERSINPRLKQMKYSTMMVILKSLIKAKR